MTMDSYDSRQRESVAGRLKKIKQSFRLQMNGVASRSMREKGAAYHLNWGVPFVQLQEMARQYGKDEALATALWREDIRECKILATLLMPAERMQPDLIELWMEQLSTQEMAEMLAFNLFQHLPTASVWAYRWLASPRPVVQICGYHVLSRLFAQGRVPDEHGAHELLNQAHPT